jgi:UDP-glucose 4-epimerase
VSAPAGPAPEARIDPAAWAGRPVLITGGLGFIGSNLARRLVGLGAEVTLMDALIPDHGGNEFNVRDIRARVDVHIADVRDRAAMDRLVVGKDVLFNLAGQISHIDSMRDPFTDLEINCWSQLSILEACRHSNRKMTIVYAASRQQYGRPRYLPVDEQHVVRPVDVNGINKTAGEAYHLVYGEVYGLRAVSLRLTNTYGPGQLVRHDRQGFIGWFVRQAVEGRTIELFVDGSQRRDLNHVDDVVDAFLLAASVDGAPGRVYNLAGSEPVSLRTLAEKLVELSGKGAVRCVPWHADRKPIDIGDYHGSHAQITIELGRAPRTALRDGLLRTVRHYQVHLADYL